MGNRRGGAAKDTALNNFTVEPGGGAEAIPPEAVNTSPDAGSFSSELIDSETELSSGGGEVVNPEVFVDSMS